DNLWIGTEDAGLNKLDPKTGIFTHFKPGKQKGSISYQNVHGLLANGNELWIGTYEHGLDVMDLKTEKVVRHYEKSANPNSLSSNFIVTIYKTREGDILIGTWNGLYKYNKAGDNFKLLPYFNRQAQSIWEDENGTLWVASYGDGVYYYNKKSGLHGSFKYNAQNTNSLTDNYVNNIFEDSKKNIWFCTESGLCRYDATSKKIIRQINEPILSNNQVFKILEDSRGILWISTSQGLVRLDRTNDQTRIYNTNNGLLSEQFNYNSAFRSKEGTLYFGTVKGMIAFNPLGISADKYIAPVYVTDIKINNVSPKIGISSRLQQSSLYTSSIHLPYDSSTVTIDVASLSYTMPALNQYRYKMEGLDKDWSPVQNNHRIYYTKLPPGNYKFRIKGSNGDGVWNEKEADLTIEVSPPIWASTWAYILYIIMTLGIASVIIKYYTIAFKEKNKRKIKTLEIEKEREVYNAKIEFFTNITHEIRTPLTLIKLPLEKLLKGDINTGTLHENLAMIEKNTNRLIFLTNQLLDFRKAEANNYTLNFVKTDVNDLLKELFATYKPVTEEKKISFRLEMPRITLLAYIDPEAFRKILTNLFSNALKYAESYVTVRLLPFNSDDHLFYIEFKNDGYLIPDEMKDKIFEPFYRLKHTEKFAGTGIGLPLARSLAELHKGTLELKKHPDAFNLFLLSIPIHQETEINFNDYETIAIESPSDKQQEDTREPLHNASILIVEDNIEIATFLQKELQNSYNIYIASDGNQALDVLTAENISIVISDIMMPVMDGIELCRRIKTDVQYSHIPVVLLTAKNTMESKIMGLENGADAYIEKPFAMEHLQAQIKSLLLNRENTQQFYAHSPLAHIKGIACTKADKEFLETLQAAIDENITDIDLHVDTLAKLMNMSRGTFYRKIKGLSDLTPNELINVSRLKKAAGLLSQGNYRITEVANMVGYTVPSNFSRDFNKQFGISPSNYLRDLKEQGQDE
ncbi:MAG TPA: response regulator, partial [Hanamia sp.]|nr:response regulator [Hanamia sp.]